HHRDQRGKEHVTSVAERIREVGIDGDWCSEVRGLEEPGLHAHAAEVGICDAFLGSRVLTAEYRVNEFGRAVWDALRNTDCDCQIVGHNTVFAELQTSEESVQSAEAAEVACVLRLAHELW